MGSVGGLAGGAAGRELRQGGEESLEVGAGGVGGQVPCRGPAEGVLHRVVGGVRAGMGYLGAATWEDLQGRARFIRISPAAVHESHAHGVLITRESPNYPGSA